VNWTAADEATSIPGMKTAIKIPDPLAAAKAAIRHLMGRFDLGHRARPRRRRICTSQGREPALKQH
jgi:hypothetical protein